ncbi:hypothetical protein GCM10022223_43870 [Kineosporia mesophila]|uniref:Nucleic acid-binding protein n=1 Tax=Kineosporia mesophila TaxID=566012 RepID=A0ABP6ZXK7_9ACTN|nr:hypothetical protein [Kineosporia mesophila]MCD5348814.1 hypothetical protein [Kineosporia mesophila]
MSESGTDETLWGPPAHRQRGGFESFGSADDDATLPIPAPVAKGIEAWHDMLLRLAGVLPDDLITEARGWLAEGGQVDVAQAVAFAAATGRVPVLSSDADLMAAQLREAGEDTELVDTLDRVDESVILPMPWVFAPVDPRRDDLHDHPGPIDLTSGDLDPTADDVDHAIRLAAGQESGLVAVWRAWRTPADGAPWPAPRRVFVVQTGPEVTGENLVAVAARIQDALAGAGERDPQVEVCGPGTPVPGYQSSACAHAALVWAEEPAVPVRMARVFDAVDPKFGPMFAEDHPLIEDLGELTRLLQYLGNGLPVLTTSATMGDILDPDQPDVVPLTFRTDGHWVWTDTISYYLERYGLAPEPELLSYLRLTQDAGPEVSDVALHRVLSFLQRPDEGEPVWTVPQVSA